jgi:hypothetical protein
MAIQTPVRDDRRGSTDKGAKVWAYVDLEFVVMRP